MSGYKLNLSKRLSDINVGRLDMKRSGDNNRLMHTLGLSCLPHGQVFPLFKKLFISSLNTSLMMYTELNKARSFSSPPRKLCRLYSNIIVKKRFPLFTR